MPEAHLKLTCSGHEARALRSTLSVDEGGAVLVAKQGLGDVGTEFNAQLVDTDSDVSYPVECWVSCVIGEIPNRLHQTPDWLYKVRFTAI